MTVELAVDESLAAEIIKGFRIPPQPQVLIDIQLEMLNPNYSLDDIEQIISRDVGLASALLKTVNSAYFGLRNHVTSISQAIGLLGLKSVVNLVTAVSLREALTTEEANALVYFWDNATDVAATCAVISKHFSFTAPDEAYILGLFHNCAIPLLMHRFPDYPAVIEQAYAATDKRITQMENEQLKTSHAVIGYFAARSWKLPEELCQAIALHHDVERVMALHGLDESRLKNLLAQLKLAEHLCAVHRVIGGAARDHEFERLKKPLMEYLGLTDIDLANLSDDLVDLGIIN